MTKKALVIGLIAWLVIGCMAAIAGLLYLIQDPSGVAIWVEGPPTVRVEEEFTLTVVVHNERQDQPFGLTDIDIADDYFNRFILLETSPRARSSMHIPIDESRSFSFDEAIPPGEVMRFDFRLRAITAGIARGDVDVCEGMRFLSALLQTEVTNGR